MTTVPSKSIEFSSLRIASTAAGSASFSSPRPIIRALSRAAASVTRTNSNAKLRFILDPPRVWPDSVSAELLQAARLQILGQVRTQEQRFCNAQFQGIRLRIRRHYHGF